MTGIRRPTSWLAVFAALLVPAAALGSGTVSNWKGKVVHAAAGAVNPVSRSKVTFQVNTATGKLLKFYAHGAHGGVPCFNDDSFSIYIPSASISRHGSIYGKSEAADEFGGKEYSVVKGHISSRAASGTVDQWQYDVSTPPHQACTTGELHWTAKPSAHR